MQNNHDEDQGATVERVYGMKDELGRWRYVGRTKLQKEHRKRLHQTHLQCDPLSSPLYRYMHENGLSFDDWTIHELAVVAFPDTDCGAQLETAMIRHLRAMPEGMLLLNNNMSHHENDQRRRHRAEYMRNWRIQHGQGTPNSYMAVAGRRHRAARAARRQALEAADAEMEAGDEGNEQ
jgi:hypothetical protein